MVEGCEVGFPGSNPGCGTIIFTISLPRLQSSVHKNIVKTSPLHKHVNKVHYLLNLKQLYSSFQCRFQKPLIITSAKFSNLFPRNSVPNFFFVAKINLKGIKGKVWLGTDAASTVAQSTC